MAIKHTQKSRDNHVRQKTSAFTSLDEGLTEMSVCGIPDIESESFDRSEGVHKILKCKDYCHHIFGCYKIGILGLYMV